MKIRRLLSVLALSVGVLVGATAPGSAATAVHKPLLPTFTQQKQQPGVLPPSIPGQLHPNLAGGTLAEKVIAEWNYRGYVDCTHLGCFWLYSPLPGQNCQVHHIIPQNDPASVIPRYYAALGGYSTEDLANGVYLTYAAHKLTFPKAYTSYQTALFMAYANLPGGRTPAGEHYYTSLYLAQAKFNLYYKGGPGGIPGGCVGASYWPNG
jgi:hypothetical protein